MRPARTMAGKNARTRAYFSMLTWSSELEYSAEALGGPFYTLDNDNIATLLIRAVMEYLSGVEYSYLKLQGSSLISQQ